LSLAEFPNPSGYTVNVPKERLCWSESLGHWSQAYWVPYSTGCCHFLPSFVADVPTLHDEKPTFLSRDCAELVRQSLQVW